MMPILLTLGDDGSLTLSADKERFEKNSEDFMNAMCDTTLEMVYVMGEKDGVSSAQMDQSFQTYYGSDTRSYLMTMLEGSMNLEGLSETVSDSGIYDVSGDKLLVGEKTLEEGSYLLYTLVGETLTIQESHGDGKDIFPESLLPVALTKR